MINGYALVLGAAAAVFAALSFRYARKAGGRFVALMALATGFFATAGIRPWLGALAGLSATKTGVAVLLIAAIGLGIGFYHEVIRKNQHHPVRTPTIAGLFGIVLVLTVSNFTSLLGQLAATPGHAGQVVSSTVAQVQSGQAAAAVPAGHRLIVLGIGLVVIAAIVMLALSQHRKGSGAAGGGKRGKGGKAALAGRRPPAMIGRRR